MMFQSGATDDMVTRFVALHNNALLANPLLPLIEMGPALHQAAQSAGFEVARELLGQIQQVREGVEAFGHQNSTHAPAYVESQAEPLSRPNSTSNQSLKSKTTKPVVPASTVSAKGAKSSKATTSPRSTVVTSGSNQIYRFGLATGRTSVSLPAHLLVAVRKAFGEPGLTNLVQQFYGQAISGQTQSSSRGPGSGPLRKVNKSSFIRQALAAELMNHQAGSGSLH